ncbi:DNA-binding protein [Nonlabens sp. YIK11]|uniref:helix-turn-helix domain-containing protein n=1 Tax=Nonlabens sp. YIK11 TaxID=1453349 RepID=UPI0006DC69E2|nr:helix-turn-helix transcriptional regulator [Nonlabens sp. YIK11]KQC33466.1 DNA-binding protein [Nonlabens sp. YIK11]
MVDSEEFSKRLELIMERHELNASSFAEQIGVGRSSISHILSGRNKPSLDFVLSILKSFDDVDLYWLLNGKGTYPKSSVTENSNASSESTTINKKVIVPEKANIPDQPAEQKTTEQLTEVPKKVSRLSIKNGKNITKVIWFYEDGTFEEFVPNS